MWQQCYATAGKSHGVPMSKSDRYFELIQILRAAAAPVIARDIASKLEVSIRTVYRDIATLQSMQVPILGEAGVGYVLRDGYDLPPLNLDTHEAEAVSLGLSMVARTGDSALWKSAKSAARKLQAVAPGVRHLVVSSWGVDAATVPIVGPIRAAIAAEQKLLLEYADQHGVASTRTIWPLALIYYADNIVAVAWCELRQDFRHFRLDRIHSCRTAEAWFKGEAQQLLTRWENIHKPNSVDTQTLI